MKIVVPPIFKTLELSEYSPELTGQSILVWVNVDPAVLEPFTKKLQALARMKREAESGQEPSEEQQSERLALLQILPEEEARFMSLVWSKGKDPATHVSYEDVLAIKEQSGANPRFYTWLVRSTLNLIGEYRSGATKKA